MILSTKTKVLSVFFSLWLLLLFFIPSTFLALIEYGAFLFLGILGAIFANTTGSGGGVVFIPAFNQMGFSELQSIATSFAIQCFGMTAGAITWYRYYQLQKVSSPAWKNFNLIIVVCSVFSVVGLWTVYVFSLTAPASLPLSFSWFSFCLGISIFASVCFFKANVVNNKLCFIDWCLLVLMSFFGGYITAWLSVGVGELVAIYLIIRRFDITMAVSAAVVVSAITVWFGIWQHLLIDYQIYWQVVLFAGPGAVIGGMLAKELVTFLSAVRLKLFFATWLLVIGGLGIY